MELLEQIEDYWTDRAEGYSQVNQEELAGDNRTNWRRELERHFPENRTNETYKILDIGTGPGFFSIILAEAGYQVTAVDYTEAMLEEAKKNAGALARRITYCQMDASHLAFADETFDAVLIANALHIMPRPEKALAEIYRVLKPGGQLFAPTFVHGEVPRTRLRMLAMRCAGLQIYNSWMVPQYLAFLQAGGFAVQEHALLGDTLAPLCYARAVPDKTRVTQR